jgi:hypothetical protein
VSDRYGRILASLLLLPPTTTAAEMMCCVVVNIPKPDNYQYTTTNKEAIPKFQITRDSRPR